MSFVLDCSMTMAWIFSDEATEKTDALRDSLLNDAALVPELWSMEIANVLLVATRRGRINQPEWPGLLRDLATLPIETDTESSARALTDALPVAMAHDLSVYDGVYLELAMRKRLPLATLDRELTAACGSAGIEVLGARE